MSEQIEKLFETIYKSTNRVPSVSDANMTTLIAPLVKSAYEGKSDQNSSEQINDLIRQAGGKLIERVKKERNEDETEFLQFQCQFNIRAILHNYYECEQTDMSFRKLFNHVKSQPQSETVTHDCLIQWLKRLGFSVINAPYNREVVVEMHSQKMARIKYIRHIQKLRQEERNIVHFREMTVNLHKKSQKSDENELTVFFAATKNGLLNFAFVEKNANTTENFIEWLTIISGNQPKNSVLVIEPKVFSFPQKPSLFNGSSIPSSFKYERIWNNYNTFIPKSNENIESVYSIEMLDFCWRANVGTFPKKSFVDPTKTMEDAGYTVVHLPCLHNELSPMHKIDFAAILNGISESKRDIETVKKVLRTRLDSSTAQEWQRHFEDVVRVEKDFLRFEALLSEEDDVIEMEDVESDDVEFVGGYSSVVISDEDDE